MKGIHRYVIAGATAALLGLGAAMPAAAGTISFSSLPNNNTSSNIQLTGSVPAILQVSVSGATGVYDSLDLTTQQTGLTVATVGERTNNKNGYTVTVSSANLANGHCASATTPCLYSSTSTEALSYTANKDSAAMSFSSNTATWSDSNAKTQGTGSEANLNIDYNGSNVFLAAASDYQDTLTFTIAAK